MKSIYVSPEIVYEDFSLSTNIAGSCEVKTNTPSARQCGLEMYPDSGKFVFIDDTTGCNYTTGVTPDGQYNGTCYDVPQDSRDLFNS